MNDNHSPTTTAPNTRPAGQAFTPGPQRVSKQEIADLLRGRWHDVYRQLGIIKQAELSTKPWYSSRSPLRADSNPSFGFNADHGGWIDHGTDETGDAFGLLMEAMGLEFTDVLKRLNTLAEDWGLTKGVTIEQYARARDFDERWLKREFFVRSGVFENQPCIDMPYLDAEGTEITYRRRIGLAGKDRFRWAKGAKAGELVYGLEKAAGFKGERLYVAEGESNLHAARWHKLQCLTIPGKGSGHEALAKAIVGCSAVKEVIVLLDPDADKLATSIAKELQSQGWTGQVKAVVVKSVCGVKDICDLHVDKTDAEFDQEIAKLDAAAMVINTDQAPAVGRPMIVVKNRALHDVADEVLQAILARNDPPSVFQRDGKLCRILKQKNGTSIQPFDEPSLRNAMSRAARFVADSGEDNREIYPPVDIVRDILCRNVWDLPCLDRIVQTPVVDADGQMITTPGYHPSLCLWYEPNHGALPEVQDKPTEQDVAQARQMLLDELFVDFPFDSEASRANAIGAALVPLVRILIDGPTPLHAIEAPTAGTGKGLLVDAITMPIVGEQAQPMTEAKDDEEWRKRVMAALAMASPVLFIDNINRSLKSGALASALTTETFSDRELGTSTMMSAPVRCLWIATGNNLGMSDEINRRVVLCRIDAKTDQPYLRSQFKHPELRTWIRQNRERLLWAYLVLVRAWIEAGKPSGPRTMGSYESYARVIGGILKTAGIEGFLGNLEESYKRGNEEMNEWRAFAKKWWDTFGDKEVSVQQLYKELLEINDLLLPTVIRSLSPHGRKVKLGQALRKKKDNVIGKHRIVQVEGESRDGGQRYKLEHQDWEHDRVEDQDLTEKMRSLVRSLPQHSAHTPHDTPHRKVLENNELQKSAECAESLFISQTIEKSSSSSRSGPRNPQQDSAHSADCGKLLIGNDLECGVLCGVSAESSPHSADTPPLATPPEPTSVLAAADPTAPGDNNGEAEREDNGVPKQS